MPPPRHLLWSVPLLFVLHDLEEVLTVEPWSASHRDALPEPVRAFLPVPTKEFTASVLVILAALLLAALLDTVRLRAGKPIAWSLLTAATLVANGLTHPLQALAFRGYTPGVVTALLLLIPYGTWLYRTGKRDAWMPPKRAVQLLLLGLLFQGPVAVAALLLGRAIA